MAVFAIPSLAQATERIKVVTSFSILADLVRQIGGERVDVTTLVGPDADAHAFQPTPADSKTLRGANLIIINGLGFEGWADRLVKASGYKGARLVASKGLKALAADHDHGHDKKGGKDHENGRYDPHAWQDAANVKVFVANIRDALIGADPPGRARYEAAAASYLNQLDVLDAEIKAAFAAIPKERRKVITHHDAFAYYGDAYGIAFVAPQGVTGESEPSAGAVAQLIRQIKREKIKAVFVENISNDKLVDRIVKETGARIGGRLYSDALSAGNGPASTYLDMMRHNTRLIAAAMKD
jgi:zinc/manganese transport system substrate-binding protein